MTSLSFILIGLGSFSGGGSSLAARALCVVILASMRALPRADSFNFLNFLAVVVTGVVILLVAGFSGAFSLISTVDKDSRVHKFFFC